MPVNIARDLKQHIEAGKALVVAERPIVALSLIRKRWAQLERELKATKVATLYMWRHKVLSPQIMQMERTKFTATDYENLSDVYVAEPSKAADLADQVATIYIALPLDESDLKKLLRKAGPDTFVIRYVFR